MESSAQSWRTDHYAIIGAILVPVILGIIALAPRNEIIIPPDTSIPPPPGWQKIASRKFSFWLPAEFKETKVQGIDSFVQQFDAEAMSVGLDAGWYCRPVPNNGQPEYQSSYEVIGGQTAQVASYTFKDDRGQVVYVTGIHFPLVPNSNNLGLNIDARYKNREDYETALTILRTVQFK